MNLRNLFFALGLLAIPACTTTRNPQNVSTGKETTGHFRCVLNHQAHSLNYLVYVPSATVTDGERRLPTIIFLHGSGERGTNVWLVTRHGPPKIVKTNSNFPFIVISPQCPPTQHWDTDVVIAFVKQMERRYPVDRNRVYLTGLSMGGSGTWNTLLADPGLFAAAVPICGRTDTNALQSLEPHKLDQVLHLPIWIFHGGKDPAVPVKYSIDMAAALKQLGANVKLTIYPNAKHNSWNRAYADQKLYDWLLEQNRKNNARM